MKLGKIIIFRNVLGGNKGTAAKYQTPDLLFAVDKNTFWWHLPCRIAAAVIEVGDNMTVRHKTALQRFKMQLLLTVNSFHRNGLLPKCALWMIQCKRKTISGIAGGFLKKPFVSVLRIHLYPQCKNSPKLYWGSNSNLCHRYLKKLEPQLSICLAGYH